MHQVTRLHYHKQRKLLDVQFSDGLQTTFSAEMLRVLSPSAEVRGHGKPVLVANKRDVGITNILPVGLYAAKIVFDDGHDSGLYSWHYFRQLHDNRESMWQDYLQRLQEANAVRDTKLTIQFRN